MRFLAALTLVVCASACAHPKPVVVAAPPPPPPPPRPSLEQKQLWIPRLEDRRILREEVAPESLPSPTFQADLLALLSDEDARLRRRAALAVGRVGLRDGVPPLITLLKDNDAEVRQMAAFALGLLGDPQAREPLVAA